MYLRTDFGGGETSNKLIFAPESLSTPEDKLKTLYK